MPWTFCVAGAMNSIVLKILKINRFPNKTSFVDIKFILISHSLLSPLKFCYHRPTYNIDVFLGLNQIENS